MQGNLLVEFDHSLKKFISWFHREKYNLCKSHKTMT